VVHDGDKVSIGRDPDQADVTIVDPAISRRHCALSKEGAVVRVEDLGSSNGTFLNGERIQSSEVRPGDTLKVGTTLLYMSLAAQES
jgi:pSer/pThr/pTyr-binding forkhead associated (FHA) protein